MEDSSVFTEQLKQIKNEDLRKLVISQLNSIPKYFYHIAASSTSKYHNLTESGEQGLVRHTKAVFKMAYELLQVEMFAPLCKYRDEILAAALLHDSLKMGLKEQKHTIFEHPQIAAESFEKKAVEEKYPDLATVKRISNMIAAHSGQWNTNKYSKVILPKPNNKPEAFLHMCDYLGSRKYITLSELDEFA